MLHIYSLSVNMFLMEISYRLDKILHFLRYSIQSKEKHLIFLISITWITKLTKITNELSNDQNK